MPTASNVKAERFWPAVPEHIWDSIREEFSLPTAADLETHFQPLNFRHSPENLRNPAQSGACTTRSEAQGVHIVHTLIFVHFVAEPRCLP